MLCHLLHTDGTSCNTRCMSEQLEHMPSGIPAWTQGDRMAKSLRAAGMSVQAMADYLGVARNTVGTWTGDKIKPGKQTLRL